MSKNEEVKQTNDKKILVGQELDMNEEEFQRSLIEAELQTFINPKSVKKPKSIFVVAQPGAGKSGLKSYAVNEAQMNGEFIQFIEFNPDVISTHHKNYLDIIEKYPDDSYQILQRFTRRALDEYLRQRAVEMNCNIMQEGTFGATQGYLDIINFQKNGGYAEIGQIMENGKRQIKHIKGNYDVEINVLAVSKLESLLSCFEREQYFDENGLPPRAVTIENHNCSYEKMLETIDVIEKNNLYNKMRVFKRGYIEDKPELVFITGDKRFESTVEAICYERKKQENELLQNPDDYIRRINELKIKSSKCKNYSLLNRINNLEKMFYSKLKEYNNSKVID